MKSIIALALIVSSLALGACTSHHASTPPPQPIDMGHRSGK